MLKGVGRKKVDLSSDLLTGLTCFVGEGSCLALDLLRGFTIVEISCNLVRRIYRVDSDLAGSRCRRCAVIRPPQTGGNKQITVDRRISTLADTLGALHKREADTPTLSTKCQQPCQKPSNRIQNGSRNPL